MSELNSEAKNVQEKAAKMEEWGQKGKHQMMNCKPRSPEHRKKPRKTLQKIGGDHLPGSPRHGSRGLEISPKGEWTLMAAQLVPETPQGINEWLKGAISVPELLQMSFQENSEENLIVEY